jgi:hypothetical protein
VWAEAIFVFFFSVLSIYHETKIRAQYIFLWWINKHVSVHLSTDQKLLLIPFCASAYSPSTTALWGHGSWAGIVITPFSAEYAGKMIEARLRVGEWLIYSPRSGFLKPSQPHPEPAHWGDSDIDRMNVGKLHKLSGRMDKSRTGPQGCNEHQCT